MKREPLEKELRDISVNPFMGHTLTETEFKRPGFKIDFNKEKLP